MMTVPMPTLLLNFYRPNASQDNLKGTLQELYSYRDLFYLFSSCTSFMGTRERDAQGAVSIVYSPFYRDVQNKMIELRLRLFAQLTHQDPPERFAPYVCRDPRQIASYPVQAAMEFIDHLDPPPFLHAILWRDETAALDSVNRGSQWNYCYASGRTSLEMAVRRELPNVVEFLSGRCMQLECIDSQKRTVLHLAAMQSCPKILDILLRQPFYIKGINCVNRRGEHPLIEAVKACREVQMKLLTQAGSPLDQPSSIGWTALAYAVYKAKRDEPSEFVAHLIAARASLEVRITSAITVMTLACQLGKLPVVQQLVNAGAAIEVEEAAPEEQPIAVAMKQGHQHVASWLNIAWQAVSHL